MIQSVFMEPDALELEKEAFVKAVEEGISSMKAGLGQPYREALEDIRAGLDTQDSAASPTVNMAEDGAAPGAPVLTDEEAQGRETLFLNPFHSTRHQE